MLTVVIDTEEEFDWDKPFSAAAVSTENVRYQTLAQAVFNRYGLIPTYVIDYPVASSREARAVLRSFSEAGHCEIGAHLHPWVNPPAGEAVDTFHSYPGNLPAQLEQAKLGALTNRIADGFGERPTVYKAGRYGIGEATERILLELNYRADVSIVPYYSFSGDGGPNFFGMPAQPFVTSGGLIEAPSSVHFVGSFAALGPIVYPHLAKRRWRMLHGPGIAARTGLFERLKLSPEGYRTSDMVRQTRSAMARGETFFMLTYHSSSLLPGATPYVRNEAERDEFLGRIEAYLRFFMTECGGRTAPLGEVIASLVPIDHGRDPPLGDAASDTGWKGKEEA